MEIINKIVPDGVIINIDDYKKRKALQKAGTGCSLRLIEEPMETAIEHGKCDLCGYKTDDLVKINEKWACRACLDE